jgi:hypothetical protein
LRLPLTSNVRAQSVGVEAGENEVAGSITVSVNGSGGGVGVSIGGAWYSRVVDGARKHLPYGTQLVQQIYGAGDDSGEQWADLCEVSSEGFNAFYRAIRRSMEQAATELFDANCRPRPTPYGTETDREIVEALEADPRLDPSMREHHNAP